MPYTQEQLDDNVSYKFNGPRLNQAVPENQIAGAEQSMLVGIDGRFNGCLRKFYGMKSLVRLAGVTGLTTIADYAGLSFIQEVTFQKRTTSTTYRGFVIRWDSQNDTANSSVGLVYTTDNGSAWTYLAVWSGAATAITATVELECTTDAGYLLIAVDGKATKTVYWNGSSLVAVDSGPGEFDVALGAVTEASQAADTAYYLRGNGVFQVAWRFYSSTRGIFSALSNTVNVYMDQPKLSKASGSVAFNSAGGDSGLFVDGDVITVNGRTFEADDNAADSSDVPFDITGLTTITQHANALADAINSDTANCACTARGEGTAVFIEASATGVSGNAYTLVKAETGGNTDDISVSSTTLTGGGKQTSEYIQQCKATMDFPANTAVVSGQNFAAFDALFDYVQIFRSIDLGQIPAAQIGAILYLEQSIVKTANWATSGTFDSLQAVIGTVDDTALPFLDSYDPSRDFILAPPQSGTIQRYQGITLMAQAQSDNNPTNVVHSSAKHTSPEYFTTYNERTVNPERGRALRFIRAGDSCFILSPGGITHMYKGSNDSSIQFVDTMEGFGLDGKWAAHSLGSTVVMISAGSLVMMGGNDANIAIVGNASRIVKDDWISDISASVSSGYDSLMNASFFLDPVRDEMLIIWHETQGLTTMEGANFAWMTHGPDIVTGKGKRAYFATANGLIVYPDAAKSATGSMMGLSSGYTLNGTASGGSTTTLIDSGATFHADMVEAYVYMIDGNNAGLGRIVSSVNVGTDTLTVAAFPYDVENGNRYTISPVPWKVRMAPLRKMDAPLAMVGFDLITMVGVKAKFRKISGLTAGIDDTCRVGAFRNSGSTIESKTREIDIVANPSKTVGDDLQVEDEFRIDGIDVEPYIEHYGIGTDFELTDIEVSVVPTESKRSE